MKLFKLLPVCALALVAAAPSTTLSSAPAPNTLFFSSLGVDPCETQQLPPTGKEAACLVESESCEDAFGSLFECTWQSGSSCSCTMKPD